MRAKKNRVYFGYTQTQTSAYYRMMCFVGKMKQLGLASCWHNEYNPEKLNACVNKLEEEIANPANRLEKENHYRFLCKKKKVSPFIFQLFASTWGLAFIDMIHYFKTPVITEIDDYALSVDSSNPNHQLFDPNSDTIKCIKNQLETSDAIIVSTKQLKKLYLPFNENIYIVKNRVDLDIWDKLKNNIHKSYLNIGWEGGSAHNKDLELLIKPITYIHNKYKKVRFTFIGGEIPNKLTKLERVKHIKKWIPINKYPAYKAKQGFDIELAPLRDTLFNRGKSNLRWLEASALKVPTIASNVEPYKCIKSGVTGLIAHTQEEWTTHIEALIAQPGYRKDLGNNAYLEISKDYNLVNGAQEYIEIIKEVNKKYRRKK